MQTRTALIAASAAGVLAAGGAGAIAAATRRWAAAPDPTGGEALCLPEGTEERIRTDDGAVLAATVAGDGPQLFVLAHGWTQDRRVWGHVARRLVDRGHRVAIYDHRGHGESTGGSAGYSLGRLATDLATVLRHVDARDAVVAGHSMGGMTAQALAVEHPDVVAERVKALVLVSTACDGMQRGTHFDNLGRRVMGGELVDRLMADDRWGPLLVRGTVGRRPVLAHLNAARSTLARTDRGARVACLDAIQRIDFAVALAKVEVPVSIVVGERDRLTPPARSRRLAEAAAEAQLDVIDGAGHMLPWEAPDILTDLLEAAAVTGHTEAASPDAHTEVPASR